MFCVDKIKYEHLAILSFPFPFQNKRAPAYFRKGYKKVQVSPINGIIY